MIRTDGEYTIYVLQHKFEKKGKWSHSGDASGFVAKIDASERIKQNKNRQYIGSRYPYDHFTASNEVWQKTGIHGSYDKIAAEEFMMAIARHNTEHSFRILKMVITQTSEEACSASFT